MATQTILLTAMPNGVAENGALKISILISPRLHAQNAPPSLDSFSDFIDWPQTLNNSLFSLDFNGSQISISGDDTQSANRIDSSIGLADSALWSTILPPSTHIQGYDFKDMSSKHILSYSTENISNLNRALYQQLAANAQDKFPLIKDLHNDPVWKGFINDVAHNDRVYASKQELPRNVSQQFNAFQNDRFSQLTAKQRELALFQLFHTPAGVPETQTYDVPADDPKARAKWQTFKRKTLPTKAELASLYDFHQIVSAMNQYPVLLRKMGLVIDILIEPALFNPTQDGELRVDMILPPAGQGGINITRERTMSPISHCILEGNNFSLLSGNGQNQKTIVKNRLLQITQSNFALLQQDIDGTTLKAMNTARTVMRQMPDKVRLDPTSRKERNTAVPATRNAGLMLVQKQRAEDLSSRFSHSLQANNQLLQSQQVLQEQASSESPHLYAEELTRGYRMDIWDDVSKQWHSLCQRNSQYIIDGQPLISVQDEGVIRMAATQSADRGSNTDILWLHEMMMTWTGWSLCAPMPGKIVDEQDKPGPQGAVVPDGIPLTTHFTVVPNSLPRLRYGRKYWVRARAVDLAANSLPPNASNFDDESPAKWAQAYLRFDPIRPPVIALFKPDTNTVEAPQEGESMLRMAIRTFAGEQQIDATQVSCRIALCDSASVKDAEVHGMLDSLGKMNPSKFSILASKDAALATQSITSTPPPVPDPNAPPLGKTDYAVFQEGGLHPYLPDPLCTEISARIFDHPQFPDSQIIPIPIYPDDASWPEASHFKIRLDERTGILPKFIDDERVLHIPLPKACRAKLRLSVKPNKQTLALLGIWQWLNKAQKMKVESLALNGQHWMLTPWREIELVHAVQKPLITPDIEVRIIREPRQTWAIPSFKASVSLKSTELVELMAEWHEPSRNESQPPSDQLRQDRAFSVKIIDPQGYAGKPEHQILKPDLICAGSKGSPETVDKVHEFDDTRYRRVLYHLQATSRFREYMPASVLTEPINVELTDKHIKVIGSPTVAWVPSSAPPPAPEVLYVVPTFEWVRSNNKGKQQSLRRGGGLRVYLDRPWNTTGYGEMLAVVLPGNAMQGLDPNTTPTSQPVKNFVTQWGNDPIWLSPFVNGPSPKQSDFPLARTSRDLSGSWLPDWVPEDEADQPEEPFETEDLSHPQMKHSFGQTTSEHNKKKVNIAPHDVFYDAERELWYCDIELQPKSTYFPFVRLALARYQPVSVTGNHLSNIVLADFMTLANDRWLTLNTGRDPLQRSLEVFGYSYTDSSGHVESIHAPQHSEIGTIKAAPIAANTAVEVWVEKLDRKLGEDFGWQKDTTAKVIKSKPQTTTTRAPKTRLAQQKIRAEALFQERNFKVLQKESLLPLVLIAPTLWQGSITLPKGADNPNSSVKRRLVIAEYEEYFIDDSSPYDAIPTKKDRRLVFVEHVIL